MSINITPEENNSNLKYDFIFVKRFETTIMQNDENEQIEEENKKDLSKEIEALESYPKPNK